MAEDHVELIWYEDYYHQLSDWHCLLPQAKDVTHLWELGGGTSLSMLADVPITTQSIRYSS